MKTARSGSSPMPSTATSASKLCSWRPNALRFAVMSSRPRWESSQTIIPAQVPNTGFPSSRWARIAFSSPADSIPLTIVVLSPPGITRPSRPSRSAGTRTAFTSAPSSRSIARCASKPPWIARTPTRSPGFSGTAVLQQRVGRGQLRDLQTGHRLAEANRRRRHSLGVVEVRGRLDDRPGAALWIGALEDPRADEVALGAELHHQRRVGRGGDPPRAEQRYRQGALSDHLVDDFEWSLVLFRSGRQLLRPQLGEALDPGDNLAHVAHRLNHVAGACLALGADHRRPLADPPKRLTKVGGAADEGNLESKLVDVVALVGRGQHLGLVDEVAVKRLQDLRLGEVTDPPLRHHRDRDCRLDAFDHRRVRHP